MKQVTYQQTYRLRYVSNAGPLQLRWLRRLYTWWRVIWPRSPENSCHLHTPLGPGQVPSTNTHNLSPVSNLIHTHTHTHSLIDLMCFLLPSSDHMDVTGYTQLIASVDTGSYTGRLHQLTLSVCTIMSSSTLYGHSATHVTSIHVAHM